MKKIFLLIVGFLLVVSNSYAADIQKIVPLNTKSVNVSFSNDLVLPENDTVKTDIKILKDLLVAYSYKDSDNSKKIIINLTYDLKVGEDYSLLSISGANGDIDFTVSKIPSEIDIEDKNIEKINILDSKNIEIYYKNDLDGEEFIYKILRDLGINSIYSEKGKLKIDLKSPLETFSSYILLLSSLTDVSGSDVTFSEMFYNFDTSEYLEKSKDENKETKEKELVEELNIEKEDIGKQEYETGNIEELAMNSAKRTPDTGAATWILVLLTLGFSSFYFIKSKIK